MSAGTTAHQGAGGPSNSATGGRPAGADDEEPSASQDSQTYGEPQSIPLGLPVEPESFAELKRRAAAPDTENEPSFPDEGA
jgi:hypothetical protein